MTLQSRDPFFEREIGNSYVRHLRAVERIASRDVISPNKERIRYNSIISMHKTRKEQARSFNLRQSQDEITNRNNKILEKLVSIAKTKPKFDVCENAAFIHSLNTPARLRQQMHIDHENAKLLKGILTQRSSVSSILPSLNRKKNGLDMSIGQNTTHDEKALEKQQTASPPHDAPAEPK